MQSDALRGRQRRLAQARHSLCLRWLGPEKTDPIKPRVETVQEIKDRILEAARFIDPEHLGTTATTDAGLLAVRRHTSHVAGHCLQRSAAACRATPQKDCGFSTVRTNDT